MYSPLFRGSSPPTGVEDVDLTPHRLHLAVQRCRCSRSDGRSHSLQWIGSKEARSLAAGSWPVSGARTPDKSCCDMVQTLLLCDNTTALCQRGFRERSMATTMSWHLQRYASESLLISQTQSRTHAVDRPAPGTYASALGREARSRPLDVLLTRSRIKKSYCESTSSFEVVLKL